jgi:hypothetical protein
LTGSQRGSKMKYKNIVSLGILFLVLFITPQIKFLTVVARSYADMARSYPWVDMDKAYFIGEKQRMYYHYAPMGFFSALIFAGAITSIVYILFNLFGKK